METITITLPLPPPALSANSRAGWYAKARATKSYKTAAWLGALDVINRAHVPVPFDAIEISPTFFFRKRERRDRDNWGPALKAAQDGLERAGVVKNDCTATTMPPVLKIDRDNPRVELVVDEKETSEEESSDHALKGEET